jgi:prophage tail gpP-like protein
MYNFSYSTLIKYKMLIIYHGYSETPSLLLLMSPLPKIFINQPYNFNSKKKKKKKKKKTKKNKKKQNISLKAI